MGEITQCHLTTLPKWLNFIVINEIQMKISIMFFSMKLVILSQENFKE